MNTKTLMIVIILIIIVALVGFGGVYLGTQLKTSSPAIAPSPTPTQSIVVTVTVSPTSIPTPTPTTDETETLKTVVKQLLVAEHGSDASELTISVSGIQGNYAKGGASASAGGGMWFAAKVSGNWKLVWDGNGTIGCEAVAPYPDLPKAWVPDCYDSTTQKMVTR